MKTALHAEMKFGFVDGSIKKPACNFADFFSWEKADSMVMAWIINAIDPNLHGSISYASTACEIWIDLEEIFAQINTPHIHQLWRTICLLQKDSDMSITKYYTKSKSLFDELDELQLILECNCGASKPLTKKDDEQRVHLFLGGLNNDQFS
ncbi:uncharacterized protein LOC127082349 [Lathyrus oleraceus]|uniref:uncharacterized protein LOC127082347 n=1 Tax=Pisum sativum TaxID=3888 RepID=UPI0021D19467|nr:uncharacterized protein LOC127082347 [Pisum sativum]XP_050878539.1 uncharacterized protein LOC127082348 [Pisum sativum]XP_050878540.1 uncharacterized protein LOC127082349 [Pisum sativum]